MRSFFTLLAFLIAGTVFAQIDFTNKRNEVYVEPPILVKSDNSNEQRTFAPMRPHLIKKLNENPKVLAVENRACPHKLLTVIQNYKRYSYKDSTNGKFYYKVEFQYTVAIKNTVKNEVLAQGMTKKNSAKSEKSYADAFASACSTLPYESDLNEVVEEAFALQIDILAPALSKWMVAIRSLTLPLFTINTSNHWFLRTP